MTKRERLDEPAPMPVVISILVGKRSKCESSLQTQLGAGTYNERNVKYASKGITLYTLKFINKIIKKNKSSFYSNISS